MSARTMETDLQPLHRSLQSARRRLWWQKGLLALARSLCVALGLAFTGALLTAWQAPEPVRNWFWIAGGLMPLAGLGAALAIRPSASQAARVVDLRLGLRQQLGTAEELLSRGREGHLVSMQISRASGVAEELEVSKAFPLLPRRESALALALAGATAGVMMLVALGVTLPNPISAIHLPSLSRGAAKALDQDPFSNPREADRPKPKSPAVDQVNRMLDQIQKQAQQGGVSSAATSAALAQANAELNRIANESRIRQEALDNLAKELQGTAAGREAAQTLRQGEYSQAAQQLRQMGQQSDQLSASAKQELADALNRAANESRDAKDLSKSERDAADQLRQGDYSSVVDSTDKLAQSVQDAANQRVSQGELAQTWQRLQQLNQQFGQAGSQNNQNALTPPVAQGSQEAGQRQAGLQQAQQQGNQGGQQGSELGPPQAGSGNVGGRQPGSGAPGNSRGGPPLGSQNPRLGPDGKPLELQGQVAGQFPGEPGGNSEPPSVLRQGTGNSAPSTVGGGANGPLSVPAENVFVPGDRRPTVRDYFSDGSGE